MSLLKPARQKHHFKRATTTVIQKKCECEPVGDSGRQPTLIKNIEKKNKKQN